MTEPHRFADNPDRSDGQSAATFRQVNAQGRREALMTLLCGEDHATPQVVNSFQHFAEQERLSLDHLWAAYEDDRPVASLLIVPGAGRTAILFLSPIQDRRHVDVMAKLAHRACAAQDPEHIRLIQVLLDPEQRLAAEALGAGGFTEIAWLQYMERATDDGAPKQGLLGDAGEFVTWNEDLRALFSQAILASYEDTLDCPALLGLRDIDDIIASHMSAGCFMPDLWHVLVADGKPISVLLLNKVPHRQAVELVYLGVSPEWRGRGIGKKLVEFALARAREHSALKIILAVDESNSPANSLYEALGFVAHARKLAMIFTPA